MDGERAPRWWVRHILVLIVASSCVALGLWQVGRLHERRTFNALLIERSREPRVAFSALPPPSGRGDGDPNAYRRVEVSGDYDAEREVVLRARSFKERAGNHVLTPLRLPDGTAVLVDRGWVPLPDAEPRLPAAAPPAGRVTVEGVLVPSEPKPRFLGPRDPVSGSLTSVGLVEIPRLQKQIPYRLYPLYLLLSAQAPPQTGLPEAVDLPPPGEGPHLSYAVQWFLFALVALVTYGALIRKERRRAGSGSA